MWRGGHDEVIKSLFDGYLIGVALAHRGFSKTAKN